MKNDIYVCDKCGNMIEMLHDSGNTVICCGEAMRKVEKGAKENAYEKHNPVITIEGNKITVKIGEVEHPMTEAHYIGWIELLVKGKCVYRKELNPNEAPMAVFELDMTDIKPEDISARNYCNLHEVN